MMREPQRRISSCSKPTALCNGSSERNELEQTSSARVCVLCASVIRCGRISCRTTRTPARAIRHAASLPASPPPTTSTGPDIVSPPRRYLIAINALSLQHAIAANQHPEVAPMTASRRDLLSALTGLLAAAGVPRVLAAERALELRLGPPEPFSAAMVRDRARALAAEPFGLDQALPEALAALEHGQYQGIRFRPEMALWRGLDLDVEAQFFHLGSRFRTPMHIYDVAGGLAREVLYQPELFDFGGNGLVLDLPEDLGFAGFRLHYPLNRPDHLDELAVFLGASYFRALGRNQRYGISARGVAIDTGLPKAEEFPAFRRFWLERPVPDADQLVLHALLDGPSLTGAYVFRLRPGKTTVMDVEASLFAREAIELLGIAPLTSMFLFGPNDQRGVDDFRPGVHDSEGLQIWSGSGEWSWRPLVNPEQLRLSLFGDTDLKGFGLMQRIRDFAAYEDLEA